MKSVQAACIGVGMRRGGTENLAWAAALLLLGLTVPASAEVVTLYDGAAQPKTPDTYTPTWLTYQSLEGLGLGPGQNYDAGKRAVHVNSAGTNSANGAQAGYSNYSPFGNIIKAEFPVLDRTAGYSIRFTLEVLSESHGVDDRAGFSILAVSSDVAAGVTSSIEIGFQDGRIFSQNGNFSGFGSQNNLFDPVGTGFIDYELAVSGASYELTAGGVSVLTGQLQDHFDQFTPPISFLPSPYEIPNLIFLGDDTTSAVADFNLRSLSVTTVPEPSSLALMGIGVLGALAYALRRRL